MENAQIIDENHKHCRNCYTPNRCNLSKLNNQKCEIIKCLNNQCEFKLHKCKLDEHLSEICKYSIINCINYSNGCKIKMLRLNLSKHLETCPANIVECKSFRLRTIINKEKKFENLKWPDPIEAERVYLIKTSKQHRNGNTINDFYDYHQDEKLEEKNLNNILLNNDYNSFIKYSMDEKLKFNCYYKYLLLNLNTRCNLSSKYGGGGGGSDNSIDSDEKLREHNRIVLSSLNKYLTGKNNRIQSRIFKDIFIDNCILFNDGLGCSACRTKLCQLEQERYNKLTSNLNFSDLLKTIYSYEQFINEKIYLDSAFLYMYNYYYAKTDYNSSDIDMDNNEENLYLKDNPSLNKELIKTNNEILSVCELSKTFSVVKVPIDDLKDSIIDTKYKYLDEYSSYRHKQTVYMNTCNQYLKRKQYLEHYAFYHDFLYPMCDEIDKSCSLMLYGCKKYTNKYKFYLNKNYKNIHGKIVYSNETNCIALKYYDHDHNNNNNNNNYHDNDDNNVRFNGDYEDYFEKLPIEVVHYIIEKLDSLSLYTLSLTSKYMRSICMEFLDKYGIVYLKWHKASFKSAETNERISYWKYTTHKTFSKHIELPSRVEVCLGANKFMNHVHKCPFKQVYNRTQPFKLPYP